jgi:hypothetical protein
MKIVYWVSASNRNGTVNFSVTGEGAIEEECLEDAKKKASEELPFNPGNLEFQKFSVIK